MQDTHSSVGGPMRLGLALLYGPQAVCVLNLEPFLLMFEATPAQRNHATPWGGIFADTTLADASVFFTQESLPSDERTR